MHPVPVPVADPDSECRSRWETPAYRGWGLLSWHGRFGQADVNLNGRRGAAQRPWRLGPRFDGPPGPGRHDALEGSGRGATGTLGFGYATCRVGGASRPGAVTTVILQAGRRLGGDGAGATMPRATGGFKLARKPGRCHGFRGALEGAPCYQSQLARSGLRPTTGRRGRMPCELARSCGTGTAGGQIVQLVRRDPVRPAHRVTATWRFGRHARARGRESAEHVRAECGPWVESQ